MSKNLRRSARGVRPPDRTHVGSCNALRAPNAGWPSPRKWSRFPLSAGLALVPMSVSYRFDRFELRPATRQLLVDERPTPVGARAFDLLIALVERRDQLVTKDELFDRVWPGLVVEENNLQVQVSALRKVLGQEAIATVPGHGYRFMLQPTEVASSPAAVPSVRHNLPTSVASFVGREQELADLREMLQRHRLVTLMGVGGIGKTRLAVELATALVDAYADGVWLVDLAELSDSRLVANTVASALGVPEQSGAPVLEALLRFASAHAVLVVLDNCEHVLGACAQLARNLLQAGPQMTVLATSREPMRIAGEATYPVPTLPVPDLRRESSPAELRELASVRLFLDRATAARPGFALTLHNAAAVARICHDVDGIPLAIELAAARMRAMSPNLVAERLRDRFRLLKSGDGTVRPRQQTLRATIDWSYDLLTPRERAFFLRLSVFVGGFALDAAEAVAAGDNDAPADILELLGQLVEKSLVVFDAKAERYRPLETVRQYALDRLAVSGEKTRTRDRHLAFYASLAPRVRRDLGGATQAATVAHLDAERENILHAFTHARVATGGAQAALAMLVGYSTWLTWRDVELWYGIALDVVALPDAQHDDVPRSYGLYVAGLLAYLTGRHEESYALARQSVRIARACGDAGALGRGLAIVGNAAIALARCDESREAFLEALMISQESGDVILMAGLHGSLGELHSHLGEFELAETEYRKSYELVPGQAIHAFFNLGRNAAALGAVDKAVNYLREAVNLDDPRARLVSSLDFVMDCVAIASLRRDLAFAMRMNGVIEALKERRNLRSGFVDARFHQRHVEAARAALGGQASDAAMAEGRALGFDAAIREALDWLESLPITDKRPSTLSA